MLGTIPVARHDTAVGFKLRSVFIQIIRRAQELAMVGYAGLFSGDIIGHPSRGTVSNPLEQRIACNHEDK